MAGPAPARAELGYPASLAPAPLAAWLWQAAEFPPDQVIAVSASAATAIVSRASAGGRTAFTLRAVALTPEAAARAGLLAWEMQLDIDCRGGPVRLGETRGYAARIPDGEPIMVAPATAEWTRPPPGTTLESAWRAACTPDFRPPLAPASIKLARMTKPVQPATLAPATATSAAIPARHGARAAQVVSSPLQADTQRSLTALRSRFGPQLAGLETRVEPAQVRGRTVYRGLVAGFASHDEAAAFCQALQSHGQACLAR